MATLEELQNLHADFFLKVMRRDQDPTDKNPKMIRLDLDPLRIWDNVIAAKSIRKRGRLVVFEGCEDRVRVDLWALIANRPPLIYRDVNVMKGLDYNDDISKYLIIRPVTPARVMNKRKAFRVQVGMPCMVFAQNRGENYQAVVKDVSTNGFAVEIPKNLMEEKIPIREKLSVEFKDQAVIDRKILMEGVCVRRMAEDKHILFGCQCTSAPKDYLNYVAKKQTRKAHA